MCIIFFARLLYLFVLRALYVYGFRYQKDTGNFVMILTGAVVLQSFAVVASGIYSSLRSKSIGHKCSKNTYNEWEECFSLPIIYIHK